MPQVKTVVDETLAGLRADVAASELAGLTRSWATEIVNAGGLLQNGKPLRKSEKLRLGAQIELNWLPKPEPEVVPRDVPGLEIIYDDDQIVAVNKPAGVAAHPSQGWDGACVLDGLAARGFEIATSGVHERQGIVHRLDQGTSGVMVVAKSEYAYAELKRQFKDREVRKVYHALVQGHPDPFRGTIDAPLGRDPRHEWRFAVVTDGKRAITHYETLEAFSHATLLEINIETGRTHQIRVHMSAQRHPCVGDIMYGGDPKLAEKLGISRQWLHASELEIVHPTTGEPMIFNSEYSADLVKSLEILAAGLS
ncbi:MAG: RluA family pseudouridine synthase [Microbacteriaceae bacterium]|nr:RluA family pseudouridine synthase [Microbacteriaceae bacterium]